MDSTIESERFLERFEDLMPFRVEHILLVSSPYDSFILREDGRLNELMIGESQELNLPQVPRITHVSSGAEALELASAHPRFNLIVTNLHLGDMDADELAREAKKAKIDAPVVVLAYDYREIKDFVQRNPETDIDRIFLWQGNTRILIAIVKYIEDKRNVEHDTQLMGVPVMLVVEDNIRYYSSFLPMMYTELIEQSKRLISEGLNTAHKLLRMHARCKILLASTFEEAIEQVTKYKPYLLGVVSDVEFPRKGELIDEAGFELAEVIRTMVPDIPIVLQSNRPEFMQPANQRGFSFLQKRSPTLLGDLRQFLVDDVGFGDFVFRDADHSEVGRACDLAELETLLATVPANSIVFHAEKNHFSHWLMARTEFAVAQKLRPRKVSDYDSPDHLRRNLLDSIAEYRREQNQVLVADFNPDIFDSSEPFFFRIGDGSLGGKARGLAFVRHLLHKETGLQGYAGVHVSVPPTLVLATDIFDKFLEENDLTDFAINSKSDDEVNERFLESRLPGMLLEKLLAFLEEVRYPLAVRSSSLLEDSQYQPFSGVYETFMLSNNHQNLQVRLDDLMKAVKLVYASTFSQHAKTYVRATPYRLEEEKMAVIIQQVVGTAFDSRFYPHFSGVVRSRNFYPLPPVTTRDGVAAVALGLGRTVVGGGKCLSFSPRYPRHLVQFSSVEDILANSQTEFFALNLKHTDKNFQWEKEMRESPWGLSAAESDGTLALAGSTYSAENHAVYDGISRRGARIVSFAGILKHGLFPLPGILEKLMTLGEYALGRPVEIEFAVRLPQFPDETAQFGFLQMRPLVLSRDTERLEIEEVASDRLLCQSSQVLGHGRIRDLTHAVVVDFHRFERSNSVEVAQAVAEFNAKLSGAGVPYLLIGVGRWGSNDSWLGIPVAWDQISGARVIVESGFRDFRVTPSQGSHFFQNLTAFQIGYFTVNPDAAEGFIDWDWLMQQPKVEERGCVRHIEFESPLNVIMDSRTSRGIILKPQPPEPLPEPPNN